jgi:heptosyltransferase-2
MSDDSRQPPAPVLIVPYVWIGDFVRCHSVVKLLRAQNADRAVDMVSSTLCAPLADYMPGVRKALPGAPALPARCVTACSTIFGQANAPCRA